MDFVIEMQGFRDVANNFVPKEVSIECLQRSVTAHWIINAPHEFELLPFDLKATNDYMASRMFGLHWFDGDLSLRKLYHHFYEIARSARRIYVKGEEKALFLQSIMARSIIDLGEYTLLKFTDLQKHFKIDTMCMTHALMHDVEKQAYCTKTRVSLLKAWLHSLLPCEKKKMPTSNELIYQSLQNLYKRNNKKEQFQFTNYREGRDEIDIATECSELSTAPSSSSATIHSPSVITEENEHSRNTKSFVRVECEIDRGICSRPNSTRVGESSSNSVQHG